MRALHPADPPATDFDLHNPDDVIVTTAAASMTAGAYYQDLAKTDLEPITDAELQRVLGSQSVCQIAYAPDDAPVAVSTAPGAGASRAFIKLHGRLVLMTVRYPASPGDGFELFSDDVAVATSTYGGTAGSGSHEAEARLRIGKGLDVGYGGFYGCTQ